ncbi:MAG: hypothetical protein K0V04_28980 [Deltaproteobacteria bacterium]|nr:hypothetical protein [Deltaproteobacteria bacterium]
MADEPDDGPEEDDDNPREQRHRFSRLGEQLTGLLDPESAFRRGQGLVTGVTQATKEEFIRIVSAEMRNFLDKMDAADLLQEVIAGLTIDVNMQVKFSKDGDGRAQPEITRQDAKIRRNKDDKNDKGDQEPSGSEPEDESAQ